MLFKIFMLLTIFAIANGYECKYPKSSLPQLDCATCMENPQISLDAFKTEYTNFAIAFRDSASTIGDNFDERIEVHQENIRDGDEFCNLREYIPPKNKDELIVALVKGCKGFKQNPAVSFEHLLFQEKAPEYKESELDLYCNNFVTVSNVISNHWRYTIEVLKQCDYSQVFAEKYEEPWKNCIENLEK